MRNPELEDDGSADYDNHHVDNQEPPTCLLCGSTEDNCPCEEFKPDREIIHPEDIDHGCRHDNYWFKRE